MNISVTTGVVRIVSNGNPPVTFDIPYSDEHFFDMIVGKVRMDGYLKFDHTYIPHNQIAFIVKIPNGTKETSEMQGMTKQ